LKGYLYLRGAEQGERLSCHDVVPAFRGLTFSQRFLRSSSCTALMLASSSDGFSGASRRAPLRLGNATIKRGEVEGLA